VEATLLNLLAKGLTTLVEAVAVGGAAGGFLTLVRKIQFKFGVKDDSKEHHHIA
jgi:hypothetical protein